MMPPMKSQSLARRSNTVLENKQPAIRAQFSSEDRMKKRFISRSCLCLILVAAPGFAALTSRPDGSTYVKGVVTQSNRAVRSVWVIASQSGVERGRALTGDDGKYYIAGLGSGAYDIVVFQGKQQIFSGQINLPENRLFNITITPPRALRRGR